jgi:hypothetical protein
MLFGWGMIRYLAINARERVPEKKRRDECTRRQPRTQGRESYTSNNDDRVPQRGRRQNKFVAIATELAITTM